MGQKAKTPAINRIEGLLDGNSFVEIGSFITARNTDFNMTDEKKPGDGVITGYGTVGDALVYVYSQDATVLGGSMGEMHAKKIADLYSQAVKMGAPIIGLLDCSGLRLQEATDALDAFGKLYLSQTLASGVVPQIQAVFGNCGGGMAVSLSLADFTFMEKDKAKLFVSSPNAVPNNHIDKNDYSAAKFKSKETDLVDFVGTEEEILKGIRDLITILPSNNEDDLSYDECLDDLNRSVDIENYNGDTSLVLKHISDNNFYLEVKKDFAPEMVTSFIRLNGNTVGVVANRSKIYSEDLSIEAEFDKKLTSKGAGKAARFVEFCDSFNIPVLTLVDIVGFEASECAEKHLAKAAAKLTYAYANATVPKVSVILSEAYGSAYITMNSKSIGADIVYAWDNAKIGMMSSDMAAKIIYADENVDLVKKATEYESLQSSALSAAKRGYVDDIIAPSETRKRLVIAFEMLFTKKEDRPAKKHGTV